ERPRVVSIDAEERGRDAWVVPAGDPRRVRRGTPVTIHTRQEGELGELLRDLGLRRVPREVLVGLHVRPELGHRGDWQDAPFRPLGAEPADPSHTARDHAREVFLPRADVGLSRDARELLPAAVAAGLPLPPA